MVGGTVLESGQPIMKIALPSVVDIGPGSPTGVVSGAGLKFPTRYQSGLFALDWTFGTIYSIDLKSAGAGYTGTADPFVYSSPLPVTDAIVGHDGALYFSVGGRGAQAAVFRVRYVGAESCAPPAKPSLTEAQLRRRTLEKYHGVTNAKAVDDAWSELSSEDRFLRHAARVAIESQPVEQWANRVLAEPSPQSRITGAVALARMGDSTHQQSLFDSLTSLNPEDFIGVPASRVTACLFAGHDPTGGFNEKTKDGYNKRTGTIVSARFVRCEYRTHPCVDLLKKRDGSEKSDAVN